MQLKDIAETPHVTTYLVLDEEGKRGELTAVYSGPSLATAKFIAEKRGAVVLTVIGVKSYLGRVEV